MKNLNEEIKRMISLMESKHGIIKPLVMEQTPQNLNVGDKIKDSVSNQTQNNANLQNLNVGDKIKDRVSNQIQNAASPLNTAEANTFQGLINSIIQSMTSIFDKTFFQKTDNKDDIKTNFLNDLENFKKILGPSGGSSPSVNLNSLKNRLKEDGSKRQVGLDRNNISYIDDLYELISMYYSLNKETVGEKINKINNSLKKISQNLTKIDQTTSKYDVSAANLNFREKEMMQNQKAMSLNKLDQTTKAASQNPWQQKPLTNLGI